MSFMCLNVDLKIMSTGIHRLLTACRATSIKSYIETRDLVFNVIINVICGVYTWPLMLISGLVVAVRDHEHFRLKLLYTQKKKVEQENKQLRQDREKYTVSSHDRCPASHPEFHILQCSSVCVLIWVFHFIQCSFFDHFISYTGNGQWYIFFSGPP